MRIHGFFYLVVGTGIAIISKIIDPKKFVIFMYFGIVFAIFGIVKIFIESAKKEKKVAAPPPQPHQYSQGNHYVTRHHRITRNQRVFVHYCRWCGNQLRPLDNFCSRCGQRIYR